MHAADPARDEHVDAHALGEDHGPRDRRPAVPPRACPVIRASQQPREIAPARLARARLGRCEVGELRAREPDVHARVDDGNGRGDGAVCADEALDAECRVEVVWVGHACGTKAGSAP